MIKFVKLLIKKMTKNKLSQPELTIKYYSRVIRPG